MSRSMKVEPQPKKRPRARTAQSGPAHNRLSEPAIFDVLVECRDEAQQRALYERLTAEGLSCRVLTL
jgi:hypothetical protein